MSPSLSLEHLVKRNPKLADAQVIQPTHRIEVFVQSRVNGAPHGSKARKGERLWVAEVGYGVFAKGELKEDPKNLRFTSMEDLLDRKAEIGMTAAPYLLSLLEKIHSSRKKSFQFLAVSVFSVELRDLERVLPVPKKCASQGSWFYLEPGDIREEDADRSLQITSHIPGAVRLRVYQELAKQADRHIIDIDHFVPKSVGGPGNLEENLVPIGYSLNRAKRDRIPSGLFVVAKTHPDLRALCPPGSAQDKGFLRGSEFRAAAQKITREVNSWPDLDAIRDFYGGVKGYHFGASANLRGSRS